MTICRFMLKPSDSGFILTDDGYTIDDLELGGCKLNTPKRQDLLQITLNGFGVQLEGQCELKVNVYIYRISQFKNTIFCKPC